MKGPKKSAWLYVKCHETGEVDLLINICRTIGKIRGRSAYGCYKYFMHKFWLAGGGTCTVYGFHWSRVTTGDLPHASESSSSGA